MHHIVAETKKEYKRESEKIDAVPGENRKNADFHNQRFLVLGILVQNFIGFGAECFPGSQSQAYPVLPG